MSRSIRVSRPALAAALACAAAAAGCGTDDPSCFFGPGTCQGGSNPGAIGAEATLPTDGAWILDTAPVVEQFRPNAGNAHNRTPITLRFSESMAPASLVIGNSSAFELIELDSGGTPTLIPVQLTQSLQADGRLLVLLPLFPLQPSRSYQIRAKNESQVRDLTGQPLTLAANKVIGTFTVAATSPTNPSVLTTFPADDAANVSWTPELVVVFDQPIDATTVTDQSWKLTIDGSAPVPDPDPEPVVLANPLPGTDTRLWTWKSVDSDGVATPYGPSAELNSSCRRSRPRSRPPPTASSPRPSSISRAPPLTRRRPPRCFRHPSMRSGSRTSLPAAATNSRSARSSPARSPVMS